MEFKHSVKLLTAAILATSMMTTMTACGKKDVSEDVVVDQSQVDAQASLDSAAASIAEAKGLGNEWRDTDELMAQADEAMKAGDYAKAKTLADQAKTQADNAVNQHYLEKARLKHKELSAMNNLNAEQREALAAALVVIRSGEGKKAWDEVQRVEAAILAATVSSSSYTVEKGDSLWAIAGKDEIYANPYQWPLIYKTNSAKIKDADLIYAGQEFDIDNGASAADIDAAVKHAKTRGAWSVGTSEASDSAYLAQ